MTKSLSELPIDEGASKALEILCYAYYDEYYKNHDYTFEQFMISEFFDGDSEFYDYERNETIPVAELKDFNRNGIWEHFHSEHYKGEKDGFSAEVTKAFGGEGEGDQYWMVIALSDGNSTRYFRKDGWYSSYEGGGSLDSEVAEVRPIEKAVIFYE
jgi:hypothetical protein